MLAKISLLTALLVAAIYPLSFWISAKDPLKNYFHRFHTGLANVLCGLGAAALSTMHPGNVFTCTAFFWLGILLAVSWKCWAKESASPVLLTIPSIIGFYLLYQLSLFWFHSVAAFGLLVLGGFIFCSSLFAMNLGHWYLNAPGLPIEHLRRTTYTFAGFLALRAVLDVILALTQRTISDGDVISVFQFMLRVDGFLLWLAVFFGTLFPLGCIYFVKGTLDVKNTQASTGILYALLVSVIIGDMTYKYYLIKFGIVL